MFNFTQFKELCRAASASLDLEDLDQLGNQGFMEKEGIRIALFFDEEIIADRLFCYVDLGPITEDLRLSVYERLLTLNLLSGTKTSGVYTIDPASGNAIFCVPLMHPERLDGTELAGLLQTYIHQALELHRTLLHNTDTASIFDIANQVFGNDRTSNLAELA
jgi:hypothetical protein